MKRFYFLVINMMIACFFIACGSTWDEPNLPLEATDSYYFHVNSETIEIPQSGSEQQIPISAKCYWTVKVSPNSDWLSLSKNFGKGDDTLTVTIAENAKTTDMRSTTVIFNNGIESVGQIVYNQEGAERPTLTAFRFSRVGSNFVDCSFTFSSNHVVITEYGVCYSSSNVKPDKGNGIRKEDFNGKEGSPNITISSLRRRTTYYARAYVVSSLGIQYGDTYQFVTR